RCRTRGRQGQRLRGDGREGARAGDQAPGKGDAGTRPQPGVREGRCSARRAVQASPARVWRRPARQRLNKKKRGGEDMTRILFVCTGNICRSPTAEGVARHFIETGGLGGRIEVDSAGTQGYHVGEAPDPRAQKFARQRSYDLSRLRARKLEMRD